MRKPTLLALAIVVGIVVAVIIGAVTFAQQREPECRVAAPDVPYRIDIEKSVARKNPAITVRNMYWEQPSNNSVDMTYYAALMSDGTVAIWSQNFDYSRIENYIFSANPAAERVSRYSLFRYDQTDADLADPKIKRLMACAAGTK
jgi:hypothetical protein